MDLWLIPVDGSEPEQLTFELRDVAYPTPVDERTVLFIAREANGAGPWLWEYDLETRGPPRRAVKGVQQYLSVAASVDGRRLVAAVANPRSELWTVPILSDREAGIADASPVAGLEAVRAQAPRVSGDRIYFLSSRGSGDGLWRFENGTTTVLLRGRDAPLLHAPAISPDGKSFALSLERAGRMRLCVSTTANAVPRALSDAVEVGGGACWSPDGASIVVGGHDDAGPGLFVFSVGGGPPRRLLDGQAYNPVWSPRDDAIVYAGKSAQGAHDVFAVDPRTGRPIEGFPPDIRIIRIGERYRFLPKGDALIYMQGGERIGQDFWRLDMKTFERRRIATFDDSAEMRHFDIDATGTMIVFDRLEMNSDIIQIQLPDDE